MNYSIEDILYIVADMEEFTHQEDELEKVITSSLSDELDIEELEFVAAAKKFAPSYQAFQEKKLFKKKN